MCPRGGRHNAGLAGTNQAASAGFKVTDLHQAFDDMNGAAILIYVDGECRPLDDRREIRRRDLEMLFRSLVHFQEQRAKVLHDTGHHVPGFRRDHDLATGRHGHPFRPAGQDNPRICRRRDLAADTDPVAARQRRFRAADRDLIRPPNGV